LKVLCIDQESDDNSACIYEARRLRADSFWSLWIEIMGSEPTGLVPVAKLQALRLSMSILDRSYYKCGHVKSNTFDSNHGMYNHVALCSSYFFLAITNCRTSSSGITFNCGIKS
jgi:hypothetical protein